MAIRSQELPAHPETDGSKTSARKLRPCYSMNQLVDNNSNNQIHQKIIHKPIRPF
ncbi:MAG: hypothetical protein PHU68_06550 [Paludibacter sp.]|jgi:hypothetical protein|nr:hypothetical protein [Paludibacter sp.]